MAYRQDSVRSNIAAVGTLPQAERMAQAKKQNTKKLKLLSMGAALVPFGATLSYAIDRKRHRREYNNQLEVLAYDYREPVGRVLGINPENVTGEDLLMASKQNPQLAQVVQKLDDEKKMANKRATGTNAGILGAGLIMPGGGLITKMAVDTGAGMIGDRVAQKMSEKKIFYVNDVTAIIDAKLKSQQPVTAYDIMLLNAAKDVKWQENFIKRYRTPFHQMSEEVRSSIIATMPEMLADAEKKAYAINNGIMSQQDLVMEGVSSGSNFAGGIVRKMETNSFVEADRARREAAAQQGQVRA